MMNRIPSQSEVARLRALYPAGTRLELIAMDDPYMHPNPGDQGTVQGVDDMGQIMMRWDNGSSLSLIPGYDKFKIAKEVKK